MVERKYQNLAANDNILKPEYKEMFNTVFGDDQILNCAVMGPYGSGKTSLIESYKKSPECKNKIWRTIELPDFTASDKNTVDTIQKELINQLLVQTEPKLIPTITFKIKEYTFVKILIIMMSITLFFLSSYIVFNFSGWEEVVSSLPYLIWTIEPVVRVFALCSLVLLATSIVHKTFQLPFVIKTIELGGNSFEMDSKHGTYFAQHQEELCYVIVFEDLDRFPSEVTLEIIQELRNFNNLLNKHAKRIKPIRFIYVIKADVFIQAEHNTKFFDFIIPVIPIIDSTNAESILLEELQNLGVCAPEIEGNDFEAADDENLISMMFIQRISLYINDMRLLKNSINEFQLYAHIQKEKELNMEKLYAIILLKNLAPKVYADLQNQTGKLAEILAFSNQKLAEYCMIIVKEHNLNTTREIKTLRELNNVLTVQKSEKPSIFSELEKELGPINGYVRYLLFNDLLNNSYREYINYFHPGTLAIEDRNFLRSLQELGTLGWDYQLKNPQQVIDRMSLFELTQQSALNLSLFQALVTNENTRGEYTVISWLCENKNLDFILLYFSDEEHRKLENQSFFNIFNTRWLTFIDDVEFPNEELKQYFAMEIIANLSPKDIDEIHANTSEYIELIQYVKQYGAEFPDLSEWQIRSQENLTSLGIEIVHP